MPKNITKYSANLYLKIGLSLNAIKYLEDIQSKKIKFENTLIDSHIKTIIVEWLIVNISSLFDNGSDVISFKKLIKHNPNIPEIDKVNFEKVLKKILEDNKVLIDRLKNNRDFAIAHTGKDEKLGWDKEAVDKIIAGGLYTKDLFHIVESEKFVFLTPSNFPIEIVKEILKKLKNTLFYNINYPKVKRIDF